MTYTRQLWRRALWVFLAVQLLVGGGILAGMTTDTRLPTEYGWVSCVLTLAGGIIVGWLGYPRPEGT